MNVYRFRLIAALTAGLLTVVASAKAETPIPAIEAFTIEAFTEKVMVFLPTERTHLLVCDRVLSVRENMVFTVISGIRQFDGSNVFYPESSERTLRRCLAHAKQALADLHDGLLDVEVCAHMLRKSGTRSLPERLNASIKAYLVLHYSFEHARTNLQHAQTNLLDACANHIDSLQASSDAPGSSGPRTYINRYVQERKPRAETGSELFIDNCKIVLTRFPVPVPSDVPFCYSSLCTVMRTLCERR